MSQPDDGDSSKFKIKDYLCAGTVYVVPRCARCNAEMIAGTAYGQYAPDLDQHCRKCGEILFSNPNTLFQLEVNRIQNGK